MKYLLAVVLAAVLGLLAAQSIMSAWERTIAALDQAQLVGR
jgi:hypothetical protein